MNKTDSPSTGKLVVVRHGESEWNASGRWTGITDVGLTPKGEQEARELGSLLSDVQFDRTYTSQQIRSQETARQLLVAAHQPTQFHIAKALNERDYGVYTGQNKWEVKERVGAVKFDQIRRGWAVGVPGGETLEDVYKRTVPFYQQTIVPLLLRGKTVLIVAHGNSIRALVKYIESISDEDIVKVDMIFGTALIYAVKEDGRMVDKSTRSIAISS